MIQNIALSNLFDIYISRIMPTDQKIQASATSATDSQPTDSNSSQSNTDSQLSNQTPSLTNAQQTDTTSESSSDAQPAPDAGTINPYEFIKSSNALYKNLNHAKPMVIQKYINILLLKMNMDLARQEHIYERLLSTVSINFLAKQKPSIQKQLTLYKQFIDGQYTALSKNSQNSPSKNIDNKDSDAITYNSGTDQDKTAYKDKVSNEAD